MKQSRKCVLVGGPMDGWSGDYVDTGQEMELFGPPGECVYCYRVDHKNSTAKKAVWRYDPNVTQFMLKASGASAATASFAHPGAGAMRTLKPSDESVRVEGDRVKVRMEVRLNRGDHRWELWMDGKVHETTKQSAINSPQEAEAWLQQLGVTEILQ